MLIFEWGMRLGVLFLGLKFEDEKQETLEIFKTWEVVVFQLHE